MDISTTRRQFLRLLAIGSGSAVLAACGQRAQPSVGSAAPQSATASMKPKSGAVLQLPFWQAPSSLNYCKGADAFGAEAWTPVYEGLLSFDYKPGEDFRTQLKVVPYLAERWEQVDDVSYLFYLRKGIKWHDGQPFTADDVVFSLNYMGDKANACSKRGNLAGIKAVDKVDGTTVKVTTDGPTAYLLENLAQRETVIYPKHLADSGKLFKDVSGAIGTGPMQVTSFDPNEKTVYTAYKDYWGGSPQVAGMVTYYVPEAQTRLAGFIAKRFDMLAVVDKSQYDSGLAQTQGATGEGWPTCTGFTMYMRVDQPPLNDIRVRRAIHLTLNRQDMVKALNFGAGKINPPAVSAVNAWAVPQDELMKLPGYRLPKDEDIAQAKQLLKEAGYGDGLALSIQAVSVWENPKIATVAAQQLKQVGINVKLDFIDSGTYFSNQAKGNFQIGLNGMSPGFIDASLNQYYYSKAGGNVARIADPELDRLIELQRRSLKQDERYGVLRQIQQYLLDKLWVIPTIELAWFTMRQSYVHDVPNPYESSLSMYRAGKLWLDDRAPGRSLS